MIDRRGARSRTPDRAGTGDHDGAVEVRSSGEPADITALLDMFAAAGVELTATSRPHPNRNGTGVRIYTRARARTRQCPAAPEPTPPSSAPVAGAGYESGRVNDPRPATQLRLAAESIPLRKGLSQ